MKAAFIWNFGKAKEIFKNWHDGHRAALEYIKKKHKLGWFLENDYEFIKDEYDFLLFWTDCYDPIITKFKAFKARKGLILTTDLNLPGLIDLYDVVYCESNEVLEKARPYAKRVIKAMGTDTSFFKPKDGVKDIKYFYPATFSPWKKQSEIAYLGKDLLCVGTTQPDGYNELKACKDAGVKVEIGYFPAKKIRDYYQRTENIVIPAIHGSERTVLEAMSCNLFPKVLNLLNTRAKSYIDEFWKSGFDSPRKFILKNYSHKIFAKQLLKGIEA